jgi:hypothetical protein
VPRGGMREGDPGKRYANRKDLQQSGLQYGEGKEREQLRRAAPLPKRPTTPTPPPTREAAPVPPGALAPLTAPTMLPDEPVTAGLPIGPGAGPEALTLQGGDDSLSVLRRVYTRYPYENIRQLIEGAERGMYS